MGQSLCGKESSGAALALKEKASSTTTGRKSPLGDGGARKNIRTTTVFPGKKRASCVKKGTSKGFSGGEKGKH